MKIKTVSYSRLFQMPQNRFENERITMEADVERGEDLPVVMDQLKMLVFQASTGFDAQVAKANEILDNPEIHTGREILWAENFTEQFRPGLRKPRARQSRLKL